MATMNISLPDPMRDWVESRTESGQYANNSDYVRDLIRKDQEYTEKLQALQAAVTKGLESCEPKDFDKEAFIRRMQESLQAVTAQFTLYPEAEADLENIWHYTVDTWNVDQAIKYIADLDSAFQLLADTPLLCREREELHPPLRIHHFQHHLIVYTETAGGITVVRVLHKNMDYQSHLEKGNS